MTYRSKFFASLLLASSWPACALAQAAAPDVEGGDIIVTGTRTTGLQAAESAAPIQLLNEEAISHVGQPNLNQVLTQIVPSFTAQTQGTDMSNFSLSARLRGLSPNHTLVMVNGKRRHGSAILQVIAGPFQGSAAPSIDLIPPDAVERIEILQEGAAAQYGSDAIAGVLNIMLKDDAEGGTAKLTAGQYFDGDGDTYSASGNVGVKIGERGFLNLTGFHRRNDYTFVGYAHAQVTDKSGKLLPGRPAEWANIENFPRVFKGGGQAKSKLTIGMYNAGYDFGGVEFYSFGDISRRIGYAYQGYRLPNRVSRTVNGVTQYFPPYAVNGMNPQQNVEQDEYSLTGGFKGSISEWDWDLSATYGSDKNDIYTIESANVSLYQDTGFTPTSFYDGSFKATQFTGTLDVRREFDAGLAKPLTFAFGGEYRRDTYAIGPGDEASRYKEGGQSFPGYSLSDAGSYNRHAKSAYVDVTLFPVEQWTIDLAGRYEDYSDFGDTTIGKVTTRYDFSDAFAIRGTASTGFRAPTLAESFYSATNVAPTSASVQLPPNSAAAALLGFTPLKPEKSTNFSGGVVLRPVPRLVVTLDGYYIKVKDRIAGTSSIRGIVNGTLVNQAVLDAIALRGTVLDNVPNVSVATFTNGIDTRTWGLDLSARYPVPLDFGNLDLSVSGNYNNTKVTKNRLQNVNGLNLFDARAESYLETATPKYKAVLGALFTSGPFSANLRQTFYGKSTILVVPNLTGYGPYNGTVKATPITDLEFGYDITSWMSFAIGANNLFDKVPETPAFIEGVAATRTMGEQLENGSTTYGAPYNHGPYGAAGGYYYARLSFKF
ncbi:TonB-dependent receptor [Sphingomonas oleivorans]|uniref:TonB-dependent receptor n=1 Tax=Sphingomonas oleivorans TaxID=1735121 RepID=A0A2T5FUQ5_9SPHN|nr:TonB-dependent receptor [Sphingomonas oleivorans]PTQ08265.1 TonB-dependent receptor [Sphingomonas oleivorans]